MIYKWKYWGVALLLLAFAPQTTLRAASPTAVDLALVLAVDASMSVDESEATTQREDGMEIYIGSHSFTTPFTIPHT